MAQMNCMQLSITAILWENAHLGESDRMGVLGSLQLRPGQLQLILQHVDLLLELVGLCLCLIFCVQQRILLKHHLYKTPLKTQGAQSYR